EYKYKKAAVSTAAYVYNAKIKYINKTINNDSSNHEVMHFFCKVW
ncbi:hypothetical protein HMPREF9372_0041, partial [Sporosarcina newyorkensis 2681]